MDGCYFGHLSVNFELAKGPLDDLSSMTYVYSMLDRHLLRSRQCPYQLLGLGRYLDALEVTVNIVGVAVVLGGIV